MTKSLVSGMGAALDLGEGVAGKFKELADRDLIGELAGALADDRAVLSGALREALSAAGFEEIREFLERAAEALEPDEYLRLLAGPIAEIPARGVSWAWKPAGKVEAPKAGPVESVVKASAQANARIKPGPKYEFKGALGITGNLKSPLPLGAVSATGARSGKAALSVNFKHPQEKRVLDALSVDLPAVARLDDAACLLDAGAFRSAALAVSGKVRLGAKLRAGKSLVGSFDVSGAPVSCRVQSALSYAVDWTRTGGFRLGIRRVKGDKLRLRLTETQHGKSARSLSLGAEMRIRGLRKAVAPVMERIAELPEGLEDLVNAYSDPSAIFEREFKSRMKTLDAPAQAMLGVLAGDGDADEVVDALAGAIVAAAWSRSGNWTDMLEGKVDGVVEKALDTVEVTPDRRVELTGLIRKKTREALADLEGALREKLKAALEEDVGAGAITEALARFTGQRDAALDAMDASAATLISPLKKLLARYRALEERIGGAVEAVEKEKLAVRYARSVSRQSKTQALLVFDLDPRDAQAGALYRQMLTGDFAAAMTAGMDGASTAITLKDSVFKRIFEDRSASGITFHLFGLELASHRELSATLKVEHDLGGQIDVFEAEGAVAREKAGFGESQSMRVGSLMHFLTPPDAPDAFVVQLNYTDDNMKPRELREYVRSLEDAGLIAEGATLRLADANEDFGAPGGERPLRIDTRLALSHEVIRKIGRVNEKRITSVAIRKQLEAYRRMDWAARSLDQFASLVGGVNQVEKRILEARGVGRRILKNRLGLTGRVRRDQERKIVGLVWGVADRAGDLANFISRWRQLDGMSLTVDARADGLDDALLAEVRTLHQQMLADLRAWVDARSPLVGLAREDLSPIAAAFLASLRELAGQPAQPLIPILTYNKDSHTQHLPIA